MLRTHRGGSRTIMLLSPDMNRSRYSRQELKKAVAGNRSRDRFGFSHSTLSKDVTSTHEFSATPSMSRTGVNQQDIN